MDILGKVVRDYLKQAHDKEVKQAYVIAKDFKKDGLNASEIEELLYSSGYDATVIEEALKSLGI